MELLEAQVKGFEQLQGCVAMVALPQQQRRAWDVMTPRLGQHDLRVGLHAEPDASPDRHRLVAGAMHLEPKGLRVPRTNSDNKQQEKWELKPCTHS